MGKHEVYRFDFSGSPTKFKRTAQGFLRVSAHLTKTGIFTYNHDGKEVKEYRSDDEVFKTDSLDSLKSAPVTDLHPSEKGSDSFLTPLNAKEHIIGITENVEREGPYLKGSLIIFCEDAIKAIEQGDRKEISLGYKCRLEPNPGSLNGESYDVIQRDIVVNHVAIGPKGWGRAGSDCSIRTDSYSPKLTINMEKKMQETICLDGMDISLNEESVKSFFNNLQARLDSLSEELKKEKEAKAALENPDLIEQKVKRRFSLVEKCQKILGSEFKFDSKTDEELKLLAITKYYPEIDLKDKEPAYLEGMFDTICSISQQRTDSLGEIKQALSLSQEQKRADDAYEKWVIQSANMWQKSLAGHA